MTTIYVKAENDVPVLLPATLHDGAYRMFACHGSEDTFMGDFTQKTPQWVKPHEATHGAATANWAVSKRTTSQTVINFSDTDLNLFPVGAPAKYMQNSGAYSAALGGLSAADLLDLEVHSAASLPLPVSCTFVDEDATVTLVGGDTTALLTAGMSISVPDGLQVTAGTTILSVTDSTHFEMTADAIASGTAIAATVGEPNIVGTAVEFKQRDAGVVTWNAQGVIIDGVNVYNQYQHWTIKAGIILKSSNITYVYFEGTDTTLFPVGAYVRYEANGGTPAASYSAELVSDLRVESCVVEGGRLKVRFLHNINSGTAWLEFNENIAQTWTVFAPPDADQQGPTGGILMSIEDQQGSIFSMTDVMSSYNGVVFPGKILIPYNGFGSVFRPLHHMLFRVDRPVSEIRVRWSLADGTAPFFGHGSIYLGIEVPQTVL